MYTKEIYPADMTLNKANTNNEHCPLLDLDIYIFNRKLNTKTYDKIDDLSFPISNYLFVDGDILLLPSYGVHISQLVARICNNAYFILTSKLMYY